MDQILVLRNWLLGKRIAEESLTGNRIERYGAGIITDLAERLTEQYGKGFDRRSLYNYVKFFQLYPEIVNSASSQSAETYLTYKIPDTDWKIDMLVLLQVTPTRTSGCFWRAYEIGVAGEDP